MSEQGAKPEVLPGDLVTRVGLYESRGGDIVPITGWKDGWWITEWDGTLDWYGSDGRRRLYEGPDADRWQLLHWIGPLPASESEPETTSEQLAEIEGQGDEIQVREGRWKTRGGEIRNVTSRPAGDGREGRFPWWDAAYRQTWTSDGRYYSRGENHRDLLEYLGPIQRQSEPQPVPIQVREGRWKTRAGEIVSVSAMPTDDDNFSPAYPWWCGDRTWTHSGHLLSHGECSADLAEYLGPIEQQPQPSPQPEPEHLQAIIAAQAETIARLQSEAHELNMEIGGLERQLLGRQARIQDLETMHAAATQAVVDAGKQNDKLRNLANNLRQQFEAAANEISEQRLYLDKYDKQLDQKDAQIRDLRIELDTAQQVPQPVSDEERERIWDDATEQAGRQVIRWLRPLTLALNRQPDERFSRFMALTLSVLPDIVPELLGYAVENEVDCEE